MAFVLWIVIVGAAVIYLVRRFRSIDTRLQQEKSQREASMVAAAMAWKASRDNKTDLN